METLESTSQNSSKRTITLADWEKKLTDAKIRKEDLNKLVMDFFLTNMFLVAADKFHKESGTEFGIDNHLEFFKVRALVINAIKKGEMELGHELFVKYFQKLRISEPILCFLVDLQTAIELIRAGKLVDVVKFAQEHLSRWIKETNLEEPSRKWQQSINEYIEEMIKRTMSLLAYDDPTLCHNANIMNEALRLELAKTVNLSILRSENLGRDPKIHDLLAMLIRVQDDLEDHVDFPRTQFWIEKDLKVPSGDPMVAE